MHRDGVTMNEAYNCMHQPKECVLGFQDHVLIMCTEFEQLISLTGGFQILLACNTPIPWTLALRKRDLLCQH